MPAESQALTPRQRQRVRRLQGRNRFGEVFAHKRSTRGMYLQVYAGADCDAPVLGVGVAKAVAKRASVRNYMRRALRELVRRRCSPPPVQLVILVRKAFDRATRGAVSAELEALLRQLGLCADSSSS